MEILSCTKLSKSYDTGSVSTKALEGINLSFEAGQFCAITGQSGSGKSTLLHILGSIEAPTNGTVTYQEHNIFSYNDEQLSILRRRHFGFVFQAYNLVQELTAYENILLPIVLDKKQRDTAYIENIISMLHLEDRLHHLPSAMSGGQQQRVAIARALVNKPSILFADEPTGNLDGQTGREVLELMHYCSREFGVTLILVTHDLGIAEQADRIITLADGHIISDTKGTAKGGLPK